MGYKFLLVLILFSTSYSSAEDKSPLCSRCNCRYLDNTSLQVECLSDVQSILFINSNYSKITGQDSILELIIRNNEMVTLEKQFDYENLTKLDLSDNKISHITDKIFANLQKLETLILNRNNIENLQPNAFQGVYKEDDYYPLNALRTLEMEHNNLHSLDSDLFEHVERLERLSLAHNPLGNIDDHTAVAITNLVHLKYLDLSYTKISVLPQYFLHTPKNIQFLSLSGNGFTEIPQELKEAHSLQTLVFNDNPVENLTEKNGFPEIPTLRILHLCSNEKLETIGPGSMANLTNLAALYLAGNTRLNRIDENALAKARVPNRTYVSWPKIRKLYLNENQLSYMNLSFLARWDLLVELDLSNNPWTCECENQWMVDVLMPIYMHIDEDKAKEMRCGAPIEMVSYTFKELYDRNYDMRCLDYYGARPEEDAALLVGMFAGVLIGIPVILLFIYLYKRHWFGIFDDSPAAFSRQFYSKTSSGIYDY